MAKCIKTKCFNIVDSFISCGEYKVLSFIEEYKVLSFSEKYKVLSYNFFSLSIDIIQVQVTAYVILNGVVVK